jgi:hypothetical protein
MKTKTAILAAMALPFTAAAQDGEKKGEDKAAIDPEAAMAEYMELIQPGPMHKELAKSVGTWDMDQKYFMPGGEEMAVKGTAKTEAVLGGRYFVTEIESNSAMGPFKGISTVAYDSFNKRFVSTWIDTMGTGIMVSYGKMKDDGSIEYISDPQPDPMSGGKVVFRMVEKRVDADKTTFDMWSKSGDAEEAKMMSIVYTRKQQ